MVRIIRICPALTAAIVFIASLSFVSCRQPVTLEEYVDGPEGKALTIEPDTLSLNQNESGNFTASGGVPPYSFSIKSGEGSIDAQTGDFTSGSQTGLTVVLLSDSAGLSDEAQIYTLGSGGEALLLSPQNLTLLTGSTFSFTASGGTAPYTFTVTSGSGTIDGGTGFYTAPGAASTETISLSDSVGGVSTATVNVVSSFSDVDYEVSALNNTSATTVAGDPLDGNFTITNIDTSDGTQTVKWDVYISRDDAVYSADDLLVDMGSTGFLTAGGSTVINFSGGWASSAGNYYLIARISSSDDISNLANNTVAGGVVTLSAPPAADVDYRLATVPAGGGTVTEGDGISETFSVENIGTATGAQNVYWTAYVSSDAILDTAVDTVVDVDSLAPLAGGASSGAQTIGGTWPYSSGSYYLIISLSNSEDTNNANDQSPSTAAFTVSEPDIDYVVNSVSSTGDPALAGGAISETLTIRNSGTYAGSDAVYWTAYISSDATLDNPGDTPVDSGSISGLGAGATSASLNIDNGNWPNIASSATYYLIVDISASDELSTATANNTGSAAFTVNVPDIDYVVDSISSGGTPADIATAISETLVIRNAGADAGSADVLWSAYISDDTVLDGTDTLMDTGTTPALSGGDTLSPGISLSGTWPAQAGQFYILVTLSAADETDTLNNSGASSAFTLNAPGEIDYVVQNLSSNYTLVDLGDPVSETFDIVNVGGVTGAANVNWEVFLSTDKALDGGDWSVGTGLTGPVASGSPATDLSVNATWLDLPTGPGPGSYYMIVELTAGDETITGNNTAWCGPFTVSSPPDYIIASPSVASADFGGQPNEDMTTIGAHSFQIQESAGQDGKQVISWMAYISSDQVLDTGSDSFLESGTLSPLSSGTTSPVITLSAGTCTLPATAGHYYVIYQISSDDDEDSGNNTYVSPVVHVWEPAGHSETETNGDDGYVYDAFALLNSGDSLTINGTVDEEGLWDNYLISLGPGVTEVNASLTWSSGKDDLDMGLFIDGSLSAIDTSADTAADSEPAAPPYLFSGLDPALDYQIGVNSYLAGGTSNATGDPYTLVISVP